MRAVKIEKNGEDRLRPRRKKRRGPRLGKKASIGISMLCIIAACCLALLLTPIFDVKTVSVDGNTVVSTEEIVKASGITPGSNIFSVSLRSVRDRLSRLGGIDTVKVKRRLPTTIRITVTESVPLVYVENNGSLVGITAAGKVTGVISAASLGITSPKEEAPPDAGDGGGEENEDEDGGADGDAEEPSAEAPEPQTSENAITVVYGMGEMTYSVGDTVKFEDEKRASKLMELMDKFLSADRDFTEVDMSVYDNVTMVYRGTLDVRLGTVEELEYKMKLFQKIVEYLGGNLTGTVDLQRHTYNPKK